MIEYMDRGKFVRSSSLPQNFVSEHEPPSSRRIYAVTSPRAANCLERCNQLISFASGVVALRKNWRVSEKQKVIRARQYIFHRGALRYFGEVYFLAEVSRQPLRVEEWPDLHLLYNARTNPDSDGSDLR